jgi:hypothetical protein
LSFISYLISVLETFPNLRRIGWHFFRPGRFFYNPPCTRAFETKAIPQENPRLEMPRVFLEAAIDGFRDRVHNACAELIFHLDEIGVSEWEDRIERRVIVPSTMKGHRIYHTVHRNLKHISVAACISAAGEHMTLCLACSQGNAAVQRKLKIEGFRMGVDWLLKSRHKPYMNPQLFAEYISTILLSYIDELPSNEEFADKEAVLPMDNRSIHVQAETLQTLADHRVKVIIFSPHTIHIFTCLDLSLFGNFKTK